MIDQLEKTPERLTSQRCAFTLQEKPRSGTRETSFVVKLETIVNFSSEISLHSEEGKNSESFQRSTGFFCFILGREGDSMYVSTQIHFWGIPHLQYRLCIQVCVSSSHRVAPGVRTGAQGNHRGIIIYFTANHNLLRSRNFTCAFRIHKIKINIKKQHCSLCWSGQFQKCKNRLELSLWY